MTAEGPLREPLLRKELSGYSRRWQTYFVRVIYVGLLALIVSRFWVSMSGFALYSVSEYAELGRDLFIRFVILQMSFVTLAAVASGASMIVKEDLSGTLDLLILTPMSLEKIAWAKWKSSMAQTGTLLLCGVPVLAICVYLGGVGLWELAWSFFLTLASAALGAAFGLRYSALSRSVAKALLMALLAIVGYTLLPVAVGLTGVWPVLIVAAFTHPVYAAVTATLQQTGGLSGFPEALSFGWIGATIFSFVVSAFIVRSTSRLILKRCQSPPRPEPAELPSRYSSGLASRFQARGRSSSLVRRGVWEDRPLLWKELATRASAGIRNEWRWGLYVLFAFFLLICWLIGQGRTLGGLAFVSILFMLLAVGAGASLFAPEKAGRRWDMLLSTPVTSWQIISSKLLVGFLSPEGTGLIILFALCLIGWGYWAGPTGFLVIALVYGLALIMAYMIAAAASLFARSVAGAFTLASCVLGVLLLVVPSLLSGFLPQAPPDGFPQVISTVTNPIGVLDAEFVGPGDTLEPWSGRAFTLVVAFLGIYAAGIAGLLGIMLWKFDRAVGRA